MMNANKLIRFLSIILAFSVVSPLAAEDYSALPEKRWASDSSTTKNKSSSKQNPSAKAQASKKQRDLFLVDVGPVYLRPYQGGTDFAQMINTADLQNRSEPYGKNKALDFDFAWGLRAGMGYQGGDSRQTLKATYLQLTSHAHKTTTSDFNGNLNTSANAVFTMFLETGLFGGGFGAFFKSADSKWSLHFNMLDVAFGQKYPKKGCFTFEPFIGLKGLLIRENQSSTYTPALGRIMEGGGGGPVTASPNNTTILADIRPVIDGPGTLKQKLNLHGAGLLGGVNLDWTLCKWLSFVGSVNGALLYSSVETKRTSDNKIPSLLWIGNSHDVRATPLLEGMFALKGSYCWKSGRFIDLRIGFEEHYVFQVMKHMVLNPDASTNLSLMGWFATLGFGF